MSTSNNMNKSDGMNKLIGKTWKIGLGLIIIGLIGMAFLRFDFSSAEGKINMEKRWTFSSTDLAHLEVISGSTNVDLSFINIASSEQPYVHIEGEAREDVVKKIEATELANQKLSLDLTSKDWELFSFGFVANRTIEISVALPGDVVLETVQFDGQSANGKMNNVKGNDVRIESTSGNIRFNRIEANQITLKCTSGNIVGSGLVGTSDIACRSGNINIDGIAGETNASITSGNITLKQTIAANAKVDATSGNVKFDAAPDFAGFYDLRATSGNINAPESPRQTDQSIVIRTKSGNIRVTQ